MGSIGGSCFQELRPREENNYTCITPVRRDAMSDSSDTGVTSTVTMGIVSVPCYTRLTHVGVVVLFQGCLSGQSRVSHASDGQDRIHSGQNKGAVS